MHVRQALREAAVTALTGLTTTGARVYDSRIHPLSDGVLPCLTVYCPEEAAEKAGLGNLLDRDMTLVVRGYARGASGVEDTLDTICEEVETALTALDGAKWVTLRSIEQTFSDDGDMPIAQVEIRFQVYYQTVAGVPGTAH